MSCEHNDLYTCQDCEMSRMAGEIAELGRQLAKARSLLGEQRYVLVRAGELLDKDAIITGLKRQLAEKLAVIERLEARIQELEERMP